jgi:hypothetical protein
MIPTKGFCTPFEMHLAQKIGVIESENTQMAKSVGQMEKSVGQMEKSVGQMAISVGQMAISIGQMEKYVGQMVKSQEMMKEDISDIKKSISAIKWIITITCVILTTALCISMTMLYGLIGTLSQSVKELEMLRTTQTSFAVMAAPARLTPVLPAETPASLSPDSGPTGTEGTAFARGR